ncbi:phosphoribosylanthranilate isomerase [Nitratidesulfovibrio sp. HK-II]|uniref:phosphoribosylanthranilate isomerase n=1 Tax=Nitratidesulfovibrio sp. HK-II TaxID=2009266 RepID=UPI000E2FCA53|nr:phosphoribosylanthranilate isomerase [Nitratidesulfovibrio sp. HK-II]GBO95423.1 phosphoribosylanthranilate isomerase [Nitratidesulfovibrio sp. HK-II]
MTGATFPRLERGAPIASLIQVAGVHDLAEALALRAAGVHAMGLPLRLPVNAEDLTETEAARLVAEVERLPAPPLLPVGITYIADGAEAAAFCRALGLRRLQLHGPVTAAELARLRREMPNLFLIKSLVVRTEDNLPELLDTVRELAPLADAFITDTHDPATGADGATGRTHDWTVSAELARRSPRPVILAGGLNPDNVREAILRVRPAGVDAHTGVEGPDGRKCPDRLRRFVAEAGRGFAEAGQDAAHAGSGRTGV